MTKLTFFKPLYDLAQFKSNVQIKKKKKRRINSIFCPKNPLRYTKKQNLSISLIFRKLFLSISFTHYVCMLNYIKICIYLAYLNEWICSVTSMYQNKIDQKRKKKKQNQQSVLMQINRWILRELVYIHFQNCFTFCCAFYVS